MLKISRNNDVLVVAGDVSGDLHASNLVRELKKVAPSLIIHSIGGVRLKEVSDRFVYDLVSKGSFGFVDSVKSFGLWIKLISIVRRFLEDKKPAFVIVVDFYGFNRQVLGLSRDRDIPVYYYIPPQVWASRPKRANTISKICKEIFAIFPFEVDIYKKLGGRVSFFGHPLLDIVPDVDINKKIDIKKDDDFDYKIGILPGSRRSEIENHLGIFSKIFSNIESKFKNSKGYVFAVNEFGDEYYETIIAENYTGNNIRVVRDNNYSIRKDMTFCLTCSGTATLENALMGVPMIVGYKTSRINYELSRAVIRIPYISLVNIILKREAVKEFIQGDLRVNKISAYVIDLLHNNDKYNAMVSEVYSIRKMLGENGVNKRIAEKIVSDFEII